MVIKLDSYYCKNCNNLIGEWDSGYNFYNVLPYCHTTKSKNFNLLYFLDCNNCKKFVGIKIYETCVICLKEYKNISDWIHKYKKIFNKQNFNNFRSPCFECGEINYKSRTWFFEEYSFLNCKKL